MLRLGQSLQLDGALGNAPHLHFIAPALGRRPDPWPAGRRTAGTDVGGEAHLELAPDISARPQAELSPPRPPRSTPLTTQGAHLTPAECPLYGGLIQASRVMGVTLPWPELSEGRGR